MRLSYSRNSSGEGVTIKDVKSYYPFGLNHYLGISVSVPVSAFSPSATYKNYKYQGQELQETGFYSFKWRNYMPDVGRFFNIDPLSEKYAYQSPYNFSEDKVISHRELEGLEAVYFQNTLISDTRFKKAYDAERQTSGGKEFYRALKSQNSINVVYVDFERGATGLAEKVSSQERWNELSKTYRFGISSKEYNKISENGKKDVLLIGVSYPDKKNTAFDVAATINHEETGHGTDFIKGKEKSNAEGHKEYYGELRDTSPEDKAVLTEKKYEGTKAQQNFKQLEKILENEKK